MVQRQQKIIIEVVDARVKARVRAIVVETLKVVLTINGVTSE